MITVYNILYKIIYNIIFILAIVFIAMFIWNLVNEMYLKNKINKIVSSFKSPLYFYMLGILSVGSSMIWYPILAEVKKSGARNRDIALFLFARAIKPLLIPIQLQLLGVKYTVFLNLYLLLVSPVAAWITEKLIKS